MARFNFEKPLWHIQNSNISRLHLWAIEDIRSVLVEDDGLPVQVTCTGHRQEGQEEDGEHDGEAPGLVRQLCRIRTGAGAQDWLVRLAAWLPGCHKGWLGGGGRLGWSAGADTLAPTCLLSTLCQPISSTQPQIMESTKLPIGNNFEVSLSRSSSLDAGLSKSKEMMSTKCGRSRAQGGE